jgi:hypothetical protein
MFLRLLGYKGLGLLDNLLSLGFGLFDLFY